LTQKVSNDFHNKTCAVHLRSKHISEIGLAKFDVGVEAMQNIKRLLPYT